MLVTLFLLLLSFHSGLTLAFFLFFCSKIELGSFLGLLVGLLFGLVIGLMIVLRFLFTILLLTRVVFGAITLLLARRHLA